MGYGDLLLAAGMAEQLYAQDPALGRVLICNCGGRPRWREEWAGNPAVQPPNEHWLPTQPKLRIGRGCLPYHPYDPASSWRARDYPPTLYLTPAERRLGQAVRDGYGPFILIEPTGRDRKNVNRCWPYASWQKLAAILVAEAHCSSLQLDRPEADRIPMIPGIPHTSFREACGIMSAARLAVLPEGGLAVGAAAVHTPAVVLWGGCTSVDMHGFPEHVNLVDDDPQTPCASSKTCHHCAEAWARLTPEIVAEQVLAAITQPYAGSL